MIETEKRKRRIISKIDRLENDYTLQQIEKIVNEMYEEWELTGEVIKPVREDLIVDDMINEQNFKGIDRNDLNLLIRSLDIQEPLVDLLKAV